MHGANMKITVSMSVSVALLRPHVLPWYRNEKSCEVCLIFILRRYGMTDETKSIQCKYGLQETRGYSFLPAEGISCPVPRKWDVDSPAVFLSSGASPLFK